MLKMNSKFSNFKKSHNFDKVKFHDLPSDSKNNDNS